MAARSGIPLKTLGNYVTGKSAMKVGSLVRIAEALGDSLEDTISGGDLLLVNTAEPRIKDNAIYAISVNGDLIVKRVQRRLDGTLIVKSDNPRYDPEEVSPSLAEQLRVIGQVVWHGGLAR